MTAETIIPTTSNTTPNSKSTVRSVYGMLKNSMLIAVREPVLLKLAIVGFVLIAVYSALFFLGLLAFPNLSGHPCHTLDEFNAFYYDIAKDSKRLFWFIICVLPFQFLGTFLTNFILMTLDSEIVRAWNGQKPDFKRGWHSTRQHINAIATWSELTMPINGMWIVSMCIVIPVLTRDNTINPFKMLWRSVVLLKNVWKEFLLGIVGMLVILYWLASMLIGSGVIFRLISAGCPPFLAWCLLALAVSVSFIGFCFAAVVCNCYLCGQYIKASEGVEPTPEAAADTMEFA